MVAVSCGIVIFAHGSSVSSANQAVVAVAHAAEVAGKFDLVATAFLEARPSLEEAISLLVARGASRILVIPYFLTLGIHLQRDLPAMVDTISKTNPNVEIHVAPPLDGHPALVQIVLDRAREAQESDLTITH